MADERTYIKVHDGIEDHPKTAALSDKAFRLLVTTWGWCSRHRTDGRIPLAVWKKRGTKGARDQLVAAGLVKLNDNDVVMHDYLEHQRSAKQIADDVADKKRGGRLGNHRRWHAERGVYDVTCEFCQESGPPEETPPPSDTDRSTDRFQDSPHRSRSDRSTSPDTDTDKGSDRDTRISQPVGTARPTATAQLAALSANGHSPQAHAIVAAFGERCTKRPPADVRNRLAVQVDALLAEDWTPSEIGQALDAWNTKGLGAGLLPSIAHELANARPRDAPTARPSTTDARVAAVLALARPQPDQPLEIPGAAS